jgi:hypothetical protein
MADGVEKLADSSVNPPERWLYRLHDNWRKKHFGDLPGTTDFHRYKIASLIFLAHVGN